METLLTEIMCLREPRGGPKARTQLLLIRISRVVGGGGKRSANLVQMGDGQRVKFSVKDGLLRIDEAL
jgi:hypothetical protein